MNEWKLVKPERELYILINRLRITANAINTFILTGEKNLFIGNTEQDNWFLALKDFYEGNKQFVGAEKSAEVTYGKAHNVKSLDDAKKYWTLQVAALFCEEKYWIRKISEHKSSFSTFPKWLQNRCRFVVEEFDKYFCYFISKDEDCGYLTQMLFMPALAKIPTRLP